MAEQCNFPGCCKPVFVKKTCVGSICNGHYKQLNKCLGAGQKPVLTPLRSYSPRPKEGQVNCIWQDDDGVQCQRPCWGNHDYCQSHQRQKWSGDTLKPIRNYNFQIGNICSKEDCNEPAKAMGLCARHYSKYRNDLRKAKPAEEQ
jgi:hypothetical protein